MENGGLHGWVKLVDTIYQGGIHHTYDESFDSNIDSWSVHLLYVMKKKYQFTINEQKFTIQSYGRFRFSRTLTSCHSHDWYT